MSGTIGINNNKILNKIETILNITEHIQKKHPGIIQDDKLEKISVNTEIIRDKYLMETIPILSDVNQDIKDNEKLKKFNEILLSNNIITDLDKQIKNIKGLINEPKEEKVINRKKIVKKLIPKIEDNNVKKLLSEYENYVVKIEISKVPYDICKDCNSLMTIYSNLSEIRCDKCGITDKLKGIIFDDINYYLPEMQNIKASHNDHRRQIRLWLAKISGEDIIEVPAKVIQKLSDYCIKNNYNKYNLRYHDWREALKSLGLTKYNDYIPLLMYKMTGISPPQLTIEEKNEVIDLICTIVEVYDDDDIKADKSNNIYYPFYFFKIFSLKFKRGNPKRALLKYIHLQGESTRVNNDKKWKKICDQLELVYEPTEKLLYS